MSNYSAKLTDDQVRIIRKSRETLKVLAARYGVTDVAIWKVKKRKSHAGVSDEPKPEWTDPDDAPELDDDFFERAEIRDGDVVVRDKEADK